LRFRDDDIALGVLSATTSEQQEISDDKPTNEMVRRLIHPRERVI